MGVRKVWNDSDNQDGLRPDSIKVHLLADGEVVDEQELTAEMGWRYIFTDLDEFKEGEVGQLIDYTVEEVVPEGYESTVEAIDPDEASASNFEITNVHTPEVIDLQGTKTWNDADNQDGKRPDSITVKLYAQLADDQDPTEVGSVEVSEATDWTYTFESLPKFRDQGVEIDYFAREEAVDGYTPEYTADGIINTHTPDKTFVDVVKIWKDGDDKEGLRPDSIKVRLLADGEVIAEQELTVEMNWRYVFTDLDEYKEGKLVHYTVEEVPVKGYETSIKGSAKDGFVITNSHTPKETEKKTSKPQTGKKVRRYGKLPQTGESQGMAIMLLGLVVISLTTVGYVYNRKQKQ